MAKRRLVVEQPFGKRYCCGCDLWEFFGPNNVLVCRAFRKGNDFMPLSWGAPSISPLRHAKCLDAEIKEKPHGET